MARKRMMHADMFSNSGFLRLSILEQKLWVFLILIADDFGRVVLDPISLKAQAFPLDPVSLDEIETMISNIEKYMSFRSYEVDGERYGVMIHFLAFQVLDKPSRSRIPDPPDEILGQLYLPRNKAGDHVGWVVDLLQMGYAGPSKIDISTDIKPDPAPAAPDEPEKPAKASRFTPPTVEEVQTYCNERGNGIDAQRFVDFYAARGWLIGKAKMKDWKAAVRTWEGRDKDGQQSEVRKYDVK